MTRNTALDGLRAVAIAMVIAYHVDKDVVPAGHWGVIVFFVLSGYLVTRSLVAERDRTGTIAFGRFYLARAVRLIPPLLLVCAALEVTGRAEWSQLGPALGFYANYARIEGVQLGLLTHVWFLAVLAHFYVVWPLVIASVPPRRRAHAVGALLVAALVWRVVAISIMSPAWVYNATDTNAAALLAGCLLAVLPARRWRPSVLAIPFLLGLVFVPAFGDRGSLVFWGGFLAIALSVAAVLYALTRPAWLEVGALVWIGTISYGLYLWHYVFVRSDISTLVALAVSIPAAAASWYLVETPIRNALTPPRRD